MPQGSPEVWKVFKRPGVALEECEALERLAAVGEHVAENEVVLRFTYEDTDASVAELVQAARVEDKVSVALRRILRERIAGASTCRPEGFDVVATCATRVCDCHAVDA